jgi:hypothetical protein
MVVLISDAQQWFWNPEMTSSTSQAQRDSAKMSLSQWANTPSENVALTFLDHLVRKV